MDRRTFFRRTAGVVATAVIAPYLPTPTAVVHHLGGFAGTPGPPIAIRKIAARIRITEEVMADCHPGAFFRAARLQYSEIAHDFATLEAQDVLRGEDWWV